MNLKQTVEILILINDNNYLINYNKNSKKLSYQFIFLK